MESAATVGSPHAAGISNPVQSLDAAANAVIGPVTTPERNAPAVPTIAAPAYRGPRQARADWDSLQQRLIPDGQVAVDMVALPELPRQATAQVVRFLQRAEAINTQVALTNVPPKTHAMLEILGIHHLVEIQPARNI